MEKLEKCCLDELKKKDIHITMYRRYVDDCFLIGNEEKIETVLETFNAWHPKLNFTVEKETQKQLRYLDMTIIRKDRTLEKMWYPKQKNGRYLDYYSESPYSHKLNTVCALIDRAIKLSDVKHREKSIKTAKEILKQNNYPSEMVQRILKKRVHKLYNSMENSKPHQETTTYASIKYIPGLSEKTQKVLKRHNITTAHQPVDKIKAVTHTKLKDKIPITQQKNVVYSVPCGVCDKKEYVGQSSQTLEKRLAQHKYSIKTGTSLTGLSQHAIEHGHQFNFAQTRILDKVENDAKRLTTETLHIKLKEPNTLNLQREAIGFSRAYDGVLNVIRKTNQHMNTNRRFQNNI